VYNACSSKRKSLSEVPEPLPVQVPLTGTAVQPGKPYPPYLVVERRYCRAIERYTVVCKMSEHLRSECLVLLFPGEMPVLPAPLRYALYRSGSARVPGTKFLDKFLSEKKNA
jgi:hypothetical protein